MNELSVKRPHLRMSLLEEHHYRESHRRPVVCRLWRLRTFPQHPTQDVTYAIGLESVNRRYLYCIGQDEASARALVKRIAECRLSPLHFGNVVEDYLWEQQHASAARTSETEAGN